MSALFPDLFGDRAEGAPPAVPGLTLVDEWLSPDDEAHYLRCVDSEPWNLAWRRPRHLYGVSYRGEARPFPQWIEPLCGRLVDEGWLPRHPDNATINDYPPGVGIAAHKDDAEFDEGVCAVSVGGDIVIDFKDPQTQTLVPVLVRARSLWVARGDARWRWLHGIAPRKSDVVDGVKRPRRRRVSLTFRTLR